MARHADALLRPAPAPAELLPQLAPAIERLARALRPALAPLCAGSAPAVRIAPPQVRDAAAFIADAEPLTIWSLLGCPAAGVRLLATLDGETALRLVDRAFGGGGELPSSLPAELPASADVIAARIGEILAAHLTGALALPPAAAIVPLARDTALGQIDAFDPATRVVALAVSVREEGRTGWELRLAIPLDALPVLLRTGPVAAAAAPRRNAPADPAAAPFAELALPLRAVLVDVALPLGTVSALRPGQVLAVPVARSVPVRIGPRTIGHGSIGTVDDRVAVRLTQVS